MISQYMLDVKHHIDSYLEEFSQDNKPETYTPIHDGDFVYVFGDDVFGVVTYPNEEGHFMFTIIMEDDGQWYVPEETKFEYASVTWMVNLERCLKCAREYLEENASVLCFVGTNVSCGFQLPWRQKN